MAGGPRPPRPPGAPRSCFCQKRATGRLRGGARRGRHGRRGRWEGPAPEAGWAFHAGGVGPAPPGQRERESEREPPPPSRVRWRKAESQRPDGRGDVPGAGRPAVAHARHADAAGHRRAAGTQPGHPGGGRPRRQRGRESVRPEGRRRGAAPGHGGEDRAAPAAQRHRAHEPLPGHRDDPRAGHVADRGRPVDEPVLQRGALLRQPERHEHRVHRGGGGRLPGRDRVERGDEPGESGRAAPGRGRGGADAAAAARSSPSTSTGCSTAPSTAAGGGRGWRGGASRSRR